MQFRIGSFAFQVAIRADLRDPVSGESILADVSYRSQVIELSSSIPPAKRLAPLIHELYHAWRFFVPMPQTEDECADLLALIVASALEDLTRRGGVEALARLTSADHDADPSSLRSGP